MSGERPKFILTLEPLPNVNAIRALRFVLKRLLRGHGFRCVDIREVESTELEVKRAGRVSGK